MVVEFKVFLMKLIKTFKRLFSFSSPKLSKISNCGVGVAQIERMASLIDKQRIKILMRL